MDLFNWSYTASRIATLDELCDTLKATSQVKEEALAPNVTFPLLAAHEKERHRRHTQVTAAALPVRRNTVAAGWTSHQDPWGTTAGIRTQQGTAVEMISDPLDLRLCMCGK